MIKTAVIAAIALFGMASQSYAEDLFYWHHSKRHSFCKSFPASEDLYGRTLYISQVPVQEQECTGTIGVTYTDEDGYQNTFSYSCTSLGTSWHIGKAGEHLKEGMAFSFGGDEYDVGDRPTAWPDIEIGRKYDHYTFCLTERGRELQNKYRVLRWVAASGGDAPKNAVQGFNRTEGQVVCPASHPSPHGLSTHPGKLIPSAGGCLISFAGKEVGKGDYQVLVVDTSAIKVQTNAAHVKRVLPAVLRMTLP